MLLNAYSLLDTKAGVHSQPWFFHHDVVAFRAIAEMINDPKSVVGQYPADFVLFRIGAFDDGTGAIASGPPVSLGSVSSILSAMKD